MNLEEKFSPSNNKYPFSLMLAFLAVLLLELALQPIPIEKRVYRTKEEPGSFEAVRRLIAQGDQKELVTIGTSRSRDGFVMPILSESLEENNVKSSNVANFAIGNARASTMQLLANRMVESDSPPRKVIIGVSPRMFFGERTFGDYPDNMLVRFSDYQRYSYEDFPLQYRATVAYRCLYNGIEEHSALLSSRGGLAIRLYDILHPEHYQLNHALNGGLTQKHNSFPTRSALAEDRISSPQIQLILSRVLNDQGEYGFDVSQIDRLADAVETLTINNIPVLIVELPLSDYMWNILPNDTQLKYEEYFFEFEKRVDVPIVRLHDSTGLFLNEDFIDLSHLNFVGAEKLTKSVVENPKYITWMTESEAE